MIGSFGPGAIVQPKPCGEFTKEMWKINCALEPGVFVLCAPKCEEFDLPSFASLARKQKAPTWGLAAGIQTQRSGSMSVRVCSLVLDHIADSLRDGPEIDLAAAGFGHLRHNDESA